MLPGAVLLHTAEAPDHLRTALITAEVQVLQATVHHTAGAPHLLAARAIVQVQEAVAAAIAEAAPEEAEEEATAGAAQEDADKNSIKHLTI